MTREDLIRLAETILAAAGVEGFALVLGLSDHTLVLLSNVSAVACGDILHKAGDDISGEEQRPALFN